MLPNSKGWGLALGSPVWLIGRGVAPATAGLGSGGENGSQKGHWFHNTELFCERRGLFVPQGLTPHWSIAGQSDMQLGFIWHHFTSEDLVSNLGLVGLLDPSAEDFCHNNKAQIKQSVRGRRVRKGRAGCQYSYHSSLSRPHPPIVSNRKKDTVSKAWWANIHQNGFMHVQPQAILPVMEVIVISCFLLLKWSLKQIGPSHTRSHVLPPSFNSSS